MSRFRGRRIGKYTLQEKLGQGGMGAVYRALDEQQNPVALKLLFGQYTDDLEYVHRFRREASLTAEFDHPHIVKLLEFGEDPDFGWYSVMEYIDGPTLRELLSRGPLPLEKALALSLQLVSALEYAHERSVVHRDIKPENLLLDGDRLVVADFGIARLETGTRLTRTGLMPGTPEYMSPEQLGSDSVGPASDLYSCGMVIYEMLAGSTPFASDNVAEVIQKQVYQLPHPPSYRNRQVPQALDQFVLRALEKKPRDRFASAAEMTRALKSLELPRPEPPRESPAPVPEPPAAPARALPEPTVMVPKSALPRAPLSPLWLLPVALLLAALATGSWLLSRQAEPPLWYREAVGISPAPLAGQLLGAVTFHGSEVAVFPPERTRDGPGRAKAVVDRLTSLLRDERLEQPDRLAVRDRQGASRIVLEPDTTLLEVDRSTAAALGAPVKETALYWQALLQDHLALKAGREPDFTLEHEREHPLRREGPPIGPIFGTIYRRCRHRIREGPLPTGMIVEAIESLPEEQEEAFLEAARSVPLAPPPGRSSLPEGAVSDL
ncbi:MAG: serine/threonine protein kinase [Armatimonadetes bacterium]|nr:serine/threonine protein kinase [Armatimonadota bacterium]